MANSKSRSPRTDTQSTTRAAFRHYLSAMPRANISMTDDEVVDFLTSGSKVLQLATLGQDGSPHQAPMWFTMDESKVVFRSFTKSQKIVNLIRDPRLSILVESGETYGELRGVMIQGTATVVSDPDYVLWVYGQLAARYPMIRDEPIEMDSDTVAAAFGAFAPKNTAIIVEPIRTTSWDHRKLGGTY